MTATGLDGEQISALTLTSASPKAMTVPQSLRHIKIFSTPAGTPSMSGKDTRVSNWFRWFPPYIQHWGIFVESQTDGFTGGTFFELAFPNGELGIMKRSRTQREAEEKNNGRWIKWEDTDILTDWTDKHIEYEANRLCRDELQRNYDVRQRNCQTFVNLLIQKIAYGPEPYIPRSTASHTFSKGPSDEHLIVVHPADQTKAVPFKGTKDFKPPLWDNIGTKYEHLWREKEKVSVPINAQGYIDLDEAQRPHGPSTIPRMRELALAYARGPDGAPQPEWTEPPRFSVGVSLESMNALKALNDENTQHAPESSSPFQVPPLRFTGPRTAHVQHVVDSIEDSFRAHVERQRTLQERYAELERWEQAGKVSDARMEEKREELRRLNSGTLRREYGSMYERYKKDRQFYRRGSEEG